MPKEPIPAVYQGLPVVNSETMRLLDRLASEKYSIAPARLMETAGRLSAEEIAAYLRQRTGDRGRESEETAHPSTTIHRPFVVVCCGRGSNGGDGLVAARYLAAKGCEVSVFICPARGGKPYPELVEKNLEKARAAGIKISPADSPSLRASLDPADAVVDALLGTGSKGRPLGAIRDAIQAISGSKKPVFALDIPSGIDPDTGYHTGAFISAFETLTFGLPKAGLLAEHAKRHVGRLKILDIGYPPELIKEVI